MNKKITFGAIKLNATKTSIQDDAPSTQGEWSIALQIEQFWWFLVQLGHD